MVRYHVVPVERTQNPKPLHTCLKKKQPHRRSVKIWNVIERGASTKCKGMIRFVWVFVQGLGFMISIL